MHVLLLTTSYKSKFNLLSAPFFRDQALALKKNGMQVGVICSLPISFKFVWARKSLKFTLESYTDKGIATIDSTHAEFLRNLNLNKFSNIRGPKFDRWRVGS